MLQKMQSWLDRKIEQAILRALETKIERLAMRQAKIMIEDQCDLDEVVEAAVEDLDWSDHIKYESLASEIELDDLAKELDMRDLAGEIDLGNLAEELKDNLQIDVEVSIT